MRISDSDRSHIFQILTELYGASSSIYLFGSRTDDSKKGGDIDLFLVNKDFLPDEQKRIHAISKLQKAIGLQKIDLVITADPEKDTRKVVQEALLHGIQLNG